MDQNEKSVPNHETQKQETAEPKTLASVLARMRAGVVPPHQRDEELLAYLADQIEAAEIREQAKRERERREYEKLHDCFWAKDAIQNIIRQMLDARDDLRRVDPKESDDLEYFAHELMKAAKKRDAPPGNAAALRSALEDTQDLLKHFTRNGGMLAGAFALHMRDNDAALAAPARNCDMFKTRDEAVRAYLEHTADGANGATMEGIVNWLFAKAEKKGGAQ